MSLVGQLCSKCKEGIVRLNEERVPQCENPRCLIPHVQSGEGQPVTGGEAGAVFAATGVLCREHED